MRHLIAFTVASLAAAACSSAPTGTEIHESTAQALALCPVGTKLECTSSNVCKCVAAPPPPVCTFVVPTPPSSASPLSWWIEAWATTQTDGYCPDIPTPTGTWSNLDPGYYSPGCFNGVPCVMGEPDTPPSCSDVYGSEPCCTYVWWPLGFALEQAPSESSGCYEEVEPACYTYSNDESALCWVSGQTFTALENAFCVEGDPLHPCGRPGGSSCAGACRSL